MINELRVRSAQSAVRSAGGLWTRPRIARALGVGPEAIADRERRGTLPPPAFTAGRSGSGEVRLWLGAQLTDLRGPKGQRITVEEEEANDVLESDGPGADRAPGV